MRERPILFSGPMVRAILDGRKTQTRRVIKPGKWLDLARGVVEVNGRWVWHTFDYDLTTPYGEPGDRLWVRETWARAHAAVFSKRDEDGPFVYAADGNDQRRTLTGNWRPSIHMPRSACRLVLEISGVRVERLQDISEQDAMAEGLIEWTDPPRVETKHYCVNRADVWETTASGAFRRLWDLLNAERGIGWDLNPWVWVIEFRKAA